MEDSRQKVILGVMIAFIFAIVGYFFFVRPAMQARNAAQPSSPVSAPAARAQVAADAQTARAAETALPEKATFAALKQQLNALAATNHVKITQLLSTNSSSSTTGGGAGATVSAQGDFPSLLQFVSGLTGSVQVVNLPTGAQLRATGPFYLIPNLTFAETVPQSATYQVQLTVLVPARAS